MKPMQYFSRLGTFLLFLGILLIILFTLSENAGMPDPTLLLFGILCFGIGGLIKWKTYAPPPAANSNRFRVLRKQSPKPAAPPASSAPPPPQTSQPKPGGAPAKPGSPPAAQAKPGGGPPPSQQQKPPAQPDKGKK